MRLEELKASLSRLSARKNLAFAASVCERLIGNYVAFHAETGWGDPQPLRDGLDVIWACAAGQALSSEELHAYLQDLVTVIPRPEDVESAYVSAALDAATSISEALTCCLQPDYEKIAEVGRLARDTVDMYLQIRDSMQYGEPGFEDHIAQDPLMRAEVASQAQAIQLLTEYDPENHSSLEHFRQATRPASCSNIGAC